MLYQVDARVLGMYLTAIGPEFGEDGVVSVAVAFAAWNLWLFELQVGGLGGRGETFGCLLGEVRISRSMCCLRVVARKSMPGGLVFVLYIGTAYLA